MSMPLFIEGALLRCHLPQDISVLAEPEPQPFQWQTGDSATRPGGQHYLGMTLSPPQLNLNKQQPDRHIRLQSCLESTSSQSLC